MPRAAEIPELFRCRFTVDAGAPFRRHLNRLEVELGGEDYGHLKRVELLAQPPTAKAFSAMEEITARLLKLSQNNYNRALLRRLGIRIYLDPARYDIYYRLAERTVRFRPLWRRQVLRRFFGHAIVAATGWRPCEAALPDCEARFVPDAAGGVLLLRRTGRDGTRPLLTATHGPYDPQSFDVALWLLRCGHGEAAVVNLGFSGREPLTDENLEKLKAWGLPLNPSNIDVIYPYTDTDGHPLCYKLEEGFDRFLAMLGGPPPTLVLDLHGCVGTDPVDQRLVVGLGGLPPFPQVATLGSFSVTRDEARLRPGHRLQQGLSILHQLTEEMVVQFCTAPHRGFLLRPVAGELRGRALDPRREAASLLPGETRLHLPAEGVRWLPGATGNALQRLAASRHDPPLLCLHVEMPTLVRRRLALHLRALERGEST